MGLSASPTHRSVASPQASITSSRSNVALQQTKPLEQRAANRRNGNRVLPDSTDGIMITTSNSGCGFAAELWR